MTSHAAHKAMITRSGLIRSRLRWCNVSLWLKCKHVEWSCKDQSLFQLPEAVVTQSSGVTWTFIFRVVLLQPEPSGPFVLLTCNKSSHEINTKHLIPVFGVLWYNIYSVVCVNIILSPDTQLCASLGRNLNPCMMSFQRTLRRIVSPGKAFTNRVLSVKRKPHCKSWKQPASCSQSIPLEINLACEEDVNTCLFVLLLFTPRNIIIGIKIQR